MKKNENNDIFSIVMLVILIILLTFFLFFLIFKNIQKHTSPLIIDTIELQYLNSEEKQIAMSDDIAVNIYNNVFPNSVTEINIGSSSSDYNYYSKLYTDNLININDLYSYDDKSTIALKKVDSSNISIINLNGINYNTFKIETLKTSYEKIFGNNTFTQNNFSSQSYPNCNINENNYICDINNNDIVNTSNMHIITKYDSYEKQDSNLFIYEKVLFFNDNEKYFATDINGNNRIEDLSSIAINSTIDNIATLNLDNYYKKYKHTFTIDDNDNYTWISTEPVTQT